LLGHKAGGQWRSLKLNGHSRRAAYSLQPRAITLHRRVVCQPGANFTKDIRCMRVRRFYQPVMYPFAFPARGDNSGTSQVREMPGDFWLIQLQHFHEKAYANFVFSNQVNQPQTSAIRKRFEEKRDTVFPGSHALSLLPDWQFIITILSGLEFLFQAIY
jgi:hypothetical protein